MVFGFWLQMSSEFYSEQVGIKFVLKSDPRREQTALMGLEMLRGEYRGCPLNVEP